MGEKERLGKKTGPLSHDAMAKGGATQRPSVQAMISQFNH